MKYIFLLIVMLTAGCQNTNTIRTIDGMGFDALILGKWVDINVNDCWSMEVEYQENGIKLVNIKLCDDLGNKIAVSYKANWSIEDHIIKEITFEASAYFTVILGVTLPHTEIDKIKLLTDKKLIILDSKGMNIYTREKKHTTRQLTAFRKSTALYIYR